MGRVQRSKGEPLRGGVREIFEGCWSKHEKIKCKLQKRRREAEGRSEGFLCVSVDKYEEGGVALCPLRCFVVIVYIDMLVG